MQTAARFAAKTVKELAMGTKQNVYGEGNYEATRQYNAATKKFIEAGSVEKAARDRPNSPEEASQMKQAEQAALLRAKDPRCRPSRNCPRPILRSRIPQGPKPKPARRNQPEPN
jgi:hypothetical protein